MDQVLELYRYIISIYHQPWLNHIHMYPYEHLHPDEWHRISHVFSVPWIQILDAKQRRGH